MQHLAMVKYLAIHYILSHIFNICEKNVTRQSSYLENIIINVKIVIIC